MCGQPGGRGFEFVLELAGILCLETGRSHQGNTYICEQGLEVILRR